MRVGYVRVSTEDQNTARQEVIMQELGVEKVYIDKLSGKNKNRQELKNMMEFIREGDIVVVESISRLARNTRDLLEIVENFKTKKVDFISNKEAIDTKTASGQFMITIFGAIAELERRYILERQREGIALAKQQKKFKGRKPIEVNNTLWEKFYIKWKSKEINGKQFMENVNLKPNTFYRKLKEYEQEKGVGEK